MKKCFTSPIIRKMQMQTTMRYHLTPVRIAVIKKTKKKKTTNTVIMENSMEVPQKIKNRNRITK
jgi:hypothetical protein